MARKFAAVLAALSLSILATTAVMAVTVPLSQGEDIAWNDPGVEVECDSVVASGMVLWHFIAHTTTTDFTMDATFADGTVVTDMAPTKIVNSYLLHWDVTTTLTTLNEASITGSGTVGSGGFNLSHVCPNPGEEIPEAPASVLLVATAAVLGGGFLVLRRREGTAAA